MYVCLTMTLKQFVMWLPQMSSFICFNMNLKASQGVGLKASNTEALFIHEGRLGVRVVYQDSEAHSSTHSQLGALESNHSAPLLAGGLFKTEKLRLESTDKEHTCY